MAASSLLLAACANGGPLENASFGGLGTDASTSGEPMVTDSVGTFQPESTGGDTAGMEDTLGATSIATQGSSGDETAGPKCGDAVAEGTEACDGTDLGGEDCASQGFADGELGCTAACEFDTSGCTSATCGNGTIEGSEVCDGEALDGETCASQGYDLGTLGCLPGCGGFEFSNCVNTMCGNGLLEMGEVCDGAALGGQTCASQGFDGGALGCAIGCGAFDTGGCVSSCAEQDLGNATGAGVASGTTVGEDDTLAPSCVGGGPDRVLSFTAAVGGNYVFDTFGSGYDTALAVFGDCGNGSQLACNDDAGGLLQSEVTVALAAGQTVNVVVDGFGAATGNWVLNIESSAPPLPACAEQDLGSALGSPVAMGTTAGEDEDLAQNCGSSGGPDRVLRFIAPVAGSYAFDTFGSGYDTVLSLHDACGGAAVVCNDDTNGLQSQVTLAMAAGQQVLVAVSGYGGATGNWVLAILQM